MAGGFFTSSESQPRARRMADVTMVVVGLLLLGWMALSVDRISSVERAILDFLAAFPSWADGLYAAAYTLGAVYVIVLVGVTVSQGRRHLDALRDIVFALALTIGTGLILARLVSGEWPPLPPEISAGDIDPVFPILRVAAVTAAIAVSSPQVTRPIRRLGWLIVTGVAIASLGLGVGLPSDALGGVGLGLTAAGIVLIAFGSPRGYPDPATVQAALQGLGLEVTDLRPSPDTSWGMRRLEAEQPDGTAVVVKAYGRDATDTQVLARAWHGLWYRDTGDVFTYSRVQAVEHEALTTMLAQRAGVTTPDILTFGAIDSHVALIALTRRGTPLDAIDLGDDGDGVIAAAWRQVALLHEARIAHGGLDVGAVDIDDGRVIIGDFQRSASGATDVQRNRDTAGFLFSTATLVGATSAVATARAGLGDDGLAAALPYLQVPSLSKADRARAPKPKRLTAELRTAAATELGIDPPPPVKLRRVSLGNLAMAALLLIAANALIGMLAGIDFAAVWEIVQDATWAWIVIGFIVGQTVFFPEATGMLYATGHPLPMGPLTVLQVAVKFIGLAVPSAAGRIAMNAAFLHKYGVSASVAVTQGAVDGIAGFVVEFGILFIAFIAGDFDLGLDVDLDEVPWGLVLLILGVLVVGVVVVVTRVARVRDVVMPALKDAFGLFRDVLTQPQRALGLLGSNLAARLILGITLWFILQAIGFPLPYFTALAVTVATNLLAGLVPIPGGIGIAEATMTALLVLAGIPEDAAFAAAVVFRVCTFYLPAVAGYPAMRWLQKHSYL